MPVQPTEQLASAPTQAQLTAMAITPPPIIGGAAVDTVAPRIAKGKPLAGMPANFATNAADLTEVAGLTPLSPGISGVALEPNYKNSQVVRAVNTAKTTGATGGSASGPVDLEADDLQHDDTGRLMTATGHVDLKQAGRTLRADRVVYDMTTDTAVATGHVIFTDATGDVHFADSATLSNNMKDGLVGGLKTYLAKGGRLTAKTGIRKDATVTTMRNVTYTTCECEEDAKGNTPWQIRARKAVYNEPAHTINYSNVTVDLLGTPVFWSPYMSTGDGQIKQKSGFLTPTIGYNSRLGANVIEKYYWGIAPDQDATLGTQILTDKDPVVMGEYRRRFDNASIKLDGSATYSSFLDQVNGQTVHRDDTLRSYLVGNGLWDMSDTWRSGFKTAVVSDDQYLRQYRISGQDVLQNELYAERFSDRDYTLIRGLAYQDIRVVDDKTKQPIVLPEITANFEGEPNETLGGRWDATFSSLGLTREGGQNLGRASLATGWQRRLTTDFGLVTTIDGHVRGDLYALSDKERLDYDPAVASDSTYKARWLPDAHAVTSYPFAKTMARAQIIVAPEASITTAPNINIDKDVIPNEDSRDVQLDAANLFQANRFPGYDRIEDGTHAAYGVRTGVYGYEGSKGEVFLGQSYRLTGDDPFPSGSGLSSKSSDYVGQVSATYGTRYGLDYRFDLDSDTLGSERHEVYGYANWRRLQLTTRYLYDKALENTDIVENRQQLFNNLNVRLTDSWRLLTGTVYDLGRDEGLRRAAVSANYVGCCLALSFNVSRNFTTAASEDNGTDFTFRIALKGLGGFPTPQQSGVQNADFNLRDLEYGDSPFAADATRAP